MKHYITIIYEDEEYIIDKTKVTAIRIYPLYTRDNGYVISIYLVNYRFTFGDLSQPLTYEECKNIKEEILKCK